MGLLDYLSDVPEPEQNPILARLGQAPTADSTGGVSPVLQPLTQAALGRAVDLGSVARGTLNGLSQADPLTEVADLVPHEYIRQVNAARQADPTTEEGAAAQNMAADAMGKWSGQSALNLAGLGSNSAMIGATPAGAVGMFGGKLAKTADHAALAKAEEMASAGADRGAIWNETGWFQGPDKQWRFEIPDNAAVTKHGALEKAREFGRPEVPLEDALHHKQLLEAYPDLTDSTVALRGLQPNARGQAVFSQDPLRDGPSAYYSISSDLWPSERTGTLLHELQHGVQRQEGFAQGSHYSQEGYGRLAGEVEANNVAKRQFMTPEERRAFPPWETQDVPDAQQIVRLLEALR